MQMCVYVCVCMCMLSHLIAPTLWGFVDVNEDGSVGIRGQCQRQRRSTEALHAHRACTHMHAHTFGSLVKGNWPYPLLLPNESLGNTPTMYRLMMNKTARHHNDLLHLCVEACIYLFAETKYMTVWTLWGNVTLSHLQFLMSFRCRVR